MRQSSRDKDRDAGRSVHLAVLEPELETSSVTVKKKRSAETALSMFEGCTPACVWCHWNRRRSSAVALSGERPRKAAKVFTHRMESCCVFAVKPRTVMSSIIRWRKALPHGGDGWTVEVPLKPKVDPLCPEAEHSPSPLDDHRLTDARG